MPQGEQLYFGKTFVLIHSHKTHLYVDTSTTLQIICKVKRASLVAIYSVREVLSDWIISYFVSEEKSINKDIVQLKDMRNRVVRTKYRKGQYAAKCEKTTHTM